jgi:hypothetical protein
MKIKYYIKQGRFGYDPIITSNPTDPTDDYNITHYEGELEIDESKLLFDPADDDARERAFKQREIDCLKERLRLIEFEKAKLQSVIDLKTNGLEKEIGSE